LETTRFSVWLRIGVFAALLFGISRTTLSKQAGTPASVGQSIDVSKIEWKWFLPEGEGQFQTSLYCSNCHTLQQVVQNRADEAGWTTIVQTMVYSHGAPIEPDDMAAITKYLIHAFPSSIPKLELPIHVNTAPKEVLALMVGLSSEDVQKIIDARTKQRLRDFAALEAAVGDKSLDKYKTSISFD
jgi:hypothetical protein